ncbi:hypothetical protein [Flaviaesturariibacter amylovorans]|uniref:Uncharacterized protein n=1 Tax=Flaviaesturariibacter amylovorans TaxID=1084520 RepID=A0ABP8GKR5_9BACT
MNEILQSVSEWVKENKTELGKLIIPALASIYSLRRHFVRTPRLLLCKDRAYIKWDGTSFELKYRFDLCNQDRKRALYPQAFIKTMSFIEMGGSYKCCTIPKKTAVPGHDRISFEIKLTISSSTLLNETIIKDVKSKIHKWVPIDDFNIECLCLYIQYQTTGGKKVFLPYEDRKPDADQKILTKEPYEAKPLTNIYKRAA